MEARGHQRPISLTALGQAVPQTLKEYEIELLKRKAKKGIQTSLELSEECEADWLPRCIGNSINMKVTKPAYAGFFMIRKNYTVGNYGL
ncbi:hypothetical protein [Pantoea eucalypti]|uniref:hypothetical protein n=1 Tax=Pantoea eucalypti TaxID=470933 RepID=UPI003AFB4709